VKTRFVEWNWEKPSIEENNGHNRSEWGLLSKKETIEKS